MNSLNAKKRLGRVILAACLSAIVFGASSQALAATNVSASPPAKATIGAYNTKLSLPPALEAIARMAEAKVGTRTVLAFIANSPLAYNLSPRDIIALKERGVPDEVITALVKHGAKMRAKYESSARADRHALNAPERRPPRTIPAPPTYYPAPVYVPYPVPVFPPYGPVTSFNNTYPTYINGQPVYSGYYVPGYGYLY